MFFNISLEVCHPKLNSNSGVCWDCHVPCSGPLATMLGHSHGHIHGVFCVNDVPELCTVVASSECSAPEKNLSDALFGNKTDQLPTEHLNEGFYTYLEFNSLEDRTHCLCTFPNNACTHILHSKPKPGSPSLSKIHPAQCLSSGLGHISPGVFQYLPN